VAKRRVDGSAIPAAPRERINILLRVDRRARSKLGLPLVRGAPASRRVRQKVPLGIVAALKKRQPAEGKDVLMPQDQSMPGGYSPKEHDLLLV